MKNWLSPSTLRELASALEQERDRIGSSLRALAEAERRLGVSQAEEGAALGPPADVASDLAEQELDFGLEEAARRRLAEVEAALWRISDDRYGTCERCGDGVEVARLRALPWARLCLGCLDRTESMRCRVQRKEGPPTWDDRCVASPY
jgi:DnaK suppressor protein